jgi:hypothetical protein
MDGTLHTLNSDFVHLCPDQECRCFPSTDFLVRADIQDMLRNNDLQRVYEVWLKERFDYPSLQERKQEKWNQS